ncbi:MAG: NAD(P)-dependent alcohol dehydrogenase [Blastocatellia bacterium]|nr:NAD(P)-dependent alcohol dehydrogenase [Blastocatellia bacterium]
MKAYAIREFGIEKLAMAERDMPVPGPGEVLVRLHAASLNFRDVMVVSGKYNPRMKLPAVPLSDGAGEVVEVGSGVSKWMAGDRVMPTLVQGWIDGGPSAVKRKTSLGAGAEWDGVLREYAAFSEDGLVLIPEYLTYEEASTLPCAALTAWHALIVSGGIKPGETVLTQGSGGVAVFALQFAKMAGARVIATSSSDEKLVRLKELGADECINYRDVPDWDRVVLDLTGRDGVDHVVEIGGAGTLERSVRAVRIGGHIAMIGSLTGSEEFDPIPLFMKAVRLQGIFVGSRVMFEEMSKAIEHAQLKPVVERVYDFHAAAEALEFLQTGNHLGKIVIRVGG